MGKKPEKLNEILPEEEVCGWLRIPYNKKTGNSHTLTYWVREGLPCISKSEKRYFLESDLVSFLMRFYGDQRLEESSENQG